MTPYYQDGAVTIYHGDCREVLPSIERADALVTDPPYGSGLSFDYARRFKPGVGDWWNHSDRSGSSHHAPMVGDSEPFDPSYLLAFDAPKKVLWGANWYANRLPDSGGWWVWDKRGGKRDVTESDWPMGEGEIAWANIGKGVRIFRHTWFGLLRDSERGLHLHPTQKPVALMVWCIERTGIPAGALVMDPYCGSGTTLRAAKDLGRKAIGIEIEERYCEIAAKRMQQEVLPLGAAS
jgi:site-specific DNA-methyltransferase (adenine-specific)